MYVLLRLDASANEGRRTEVVDWLLVTCKTQNIKHYRDPKTSPKMKITDKDMS